jgi:malate synthase A
VLTTGAVAFVNDLARRFGGRIDELLERRRTIQRRFNEGARPNFLTETASVRAGDWQVAPAPGDLQDRRVEITGPVDRKMIINALNSGAQVYMADFEDATSPTWANIVGGQANLMDAVRRTISYVAPETGKRLRAESAAGHSDGPSSRLPSRRAPLRGRRPARFPACSSTSACTSFHNAAALKDAGTGPYFYLPKLESHLEARLWNDVFIHAQQALNIPRGTIKATVLIETLPAAFEMDEILYELKDHSAGLNCGRWDYIFSSIKTLRTIRRSSSPIAGKVTMEAPFLRAYTQLLIKTCHRRGAHAMGGMAAQIPIKDDPEANEKALDKVRADKLREVREGHDGTWVAPSGPGLLSQSRCSTRGCLVRTS